MAATDDRWAELVAEAYDDLMAYATGAAADREQARVAATTAGEIAAVFDTRDHVMHDRYRARLADAYETARAARRRAETTAAIADARTSYAEGIVERNGLDGERPHPYRPRTYDDILAEMADTRDTIQVVTTEVADAVATIEQVCDRVT